MNSRPEPEARTRVVLCKWQPDLAAVLFDLPVRAYLIIDAYDRRRMPGPARLSGFERVYTISSFDSFEEIAAVAGDLEIRGAGDPIVMNHSELSQLGASYLEHLLGGGHNARLGNQLRDKRVMKSRVRKQGVATANFVSIDNSRRRAADDVIAQLDFPLVVKPALGFGTMNTIRVDDTEHLKRVLDDYAVSPLIRSKHVIVEEFVNGRELCVDALWNNGACLSFVVHEYLQPKLQVVTRAETGTPAVDGSYIMHPLSHEWLYRELRALHEAVNRALTIRGGATHLEVFFLADHTLVFGEVANRVGGIWVPMMLSDYFNRDIWRILAEARIYGRSPDPRPSWQCVGGVNLRPTKSGVIARMPDHNDRAAIDGLLHWQAVRQVGDKAPLDNPAEQYLLMTIGADSVDDFKDTCWRLAQQVRIDVD